MDSRPDTRARAAGRVLREALWVAGGALVVAFLANALSPRGLDLGRNYFPAARPDGTPLVAADSSPPGPGGPARDAAGRLAARGLRAVTLAEAVEWFRDPRHALGQIVFLDARDAAHYQAGHVPGAYLFDHYRAPAYLPTVLPLCLAAERVVVYCSGGECEDSEFAAITLRDAGVPAEKLGVLLGGFQEWQTNRLPVEVGARAGGPAREAQP